MDLARRVLGSLRIVRDHDDGLLLLLIERAHETEDFLGRVTIEVTRGLVEELSAPKLVGADGLTLSRDGLVVVTNSLGAPGKNAVTVLTETEKRAQPVEPARRDRDRDRDDDDD